VPIDPDVPGRLALTLFRLASGVETSILEMTARRLGAGLDVPDWQVRKLAEVSSLSRALEGSVGAFLDEAQRGSYGAVLDAGQIGQDAALMDLRGIARAAAAPSRIPGAGALISLAEELSGVIASTRTSILRSALDLFRMTVADTVGQVLLGAGTRRDVAQQVFGRLAARGVTGFTDVSGRRWQLGSYTEMAVRTTTQRAMTQAHTETLQANGFDLIIVSNAPQECERCRPWEGKILSLSGGGRMTMQVPSAVELRETVTVEIAGSLDEAKAAGLYHPSCRHSHGAFLPGLTKIPPAPTADPEGNAARVRLRALERAVRAAKTQEAAALDPAARARARAQVRARQAAIREHVEATPGLLRQNAREQIGRSR
jgi:hypothetical protein